MKEGKWGDLKKRVMVSFFVIVAVILLIFFSQLLWMRVVVALVLLGLIGMASSELAHLGATKEKSLPISWIVAGSVFFGASLFLYSQSSTFHLLPFFAFFLVFLIFFLLSFSKVEGAFARISFSLFPLIYVTLPLSLIFLILYSPSFEGRMWIAYLLTVTKMSDIGAYFGGKMFGKRKLAPILSPKKTWEGALVGGALSIGISLVFCLWSQENTGFLLSGKEALVLGAMIGLFGQLGDLAESLLKRDAKVKDSSCFPGLGGMLDMVDSILFSSLFLYLFLISR
jgi:phosphatidate cytidylyltransferase